MEVQRIADGLWRWTGLHPDWEEEPDPEWAREVGCVYHEDSDAVVLIDPLVPPEDTDRFLSELERDVERAARPVVVLLTVFWHERSAPELAERFAAPIWSDGRTAHRHEVPPTHTYGPGQTLPGGVLALDAHGRNECLLWIERHGTLVAGDILQGTRGGGLRLCPDDWLHPHMEASEVRRSLRALLELPVERVLVAHGEPVLENARRELERALHAPSAS
jgi:glyoxylase-like metal-dependent hydrolase (beta-lactamase superfamily II)